MSTNLQSLRKISFFGRVPGSLGDMAVKPTVAVRAILVGSVAAFAKIAGAMKAASGAKMGAAAAAMTAAATAAMAGSKQDQKDTPQSTPK